MKKNIKYIFPALLAILFLFGSWTNVKAQEQTVDDFRMLFYLNTTKQSDDSRLLEVEFKARNKENKKDRIAVTGALIKFYNVTEDDEILLGEASTNKVGIASLILPPDQEYISDEDGYINFLARFEETDAMDEEEEELAVMDLQLELNLEVVDSIQTVYVNAYTLDSLGEQVEVEELDIIIGVESMLSNLILDEGTLEEGEYEYEMPMDLPGNQNGELNVYVYVDDHEDFAYVYKSDMKKWGVAKLSDGKEKNTLWTKAAPTWMYIVLTIMLVGIWANFAYTIINLVKIKRMGTN